MRVTGAAGMAGFGTNESGRQAVAKLASVVVCILGGLACLVVAMAGRSSIEPWAVLVCIGMFLLPFALSAIGRVREEMKEQEIVVDPPRRAIADAEKFEFRRAEEPPKIARYGTNQPPTVERIREIKEQYGTWVPNRLRPVRDEDDDF
jgi:hypothetical protein